MDKTPEEARNLIANMTTNSQQFGTSKPDQSPKKNNTFLTLNNNLLIQVLLHQIAVENGQNMKACGICSVVGHPTDKCPTLQEEPVEQVNAARIYPKAMTPHSCGSSSSIVTSSSATVAELRSTREEIRVVMERLDYVVDQPAMILSHVN